MPKPKTPRLELHSSKEAAAYLKKSDLAILPVGCVEMHGPLVPLGCDLFLDYASALVLGEQWKCLVMPPIPYVYPGASGPWAGTIDVSPEASIAYIKEVVKAALKAGFKRLVISGSHGPLEFMAQVVIRAIYQESGEIVAHLQPWRAIAPALAKEFDRSGHQVEDIYVLGAMWLLGLHGHYRPENDVDLKSSFPFPSMSALNRAGVRVPWLFNRDYQHTGIKRDLKLKHAERAAACIEKTLKQYKDIPKLLAQYQKDMRKQDKNPPWKRQDIWSV